MTIRACLRLVTVLLLALLQAPLVLAGEPANKAAARELFREASRMAKGGDWESACERYERSLSLHPAAITLYSLAVAQRTTGQRVSALENFRAFLRAERSRKARAYEARARIAIDELEREVAHVTISVTPLPADVLVELDGTRVPSVALGLARLLDPGEHTVVISAPGYEPARRTFEVGTGDRIDVDLSLARSVAEGDRADRDVEQAFPVWPIVVTGAGAVLIVSGVAVGAVGLSEADGAVDGSERAEKARQKGVAGDVMIGIGGATAAAGIAWLVFALTDAPADERAHIRPWSNGIVAGLQVDL